MKTPIAASRLGIRSSHLYSLIRIGKIRPPVKDSSGDFVWSESDLDRARAVIAVGQRHAPDADVQRSEINERQLA
jgi:hypothetical protein